MAIPPVTVTRVTYANAVIEQFVVDLADPAYRALRRRATAQQQTPEQFIAWLLANPAEPCR